MRKIIWNLLVIDSAGTLVYSWLHPKAPKDILKKYEPTMIAGFISAIIKFGHEVIAQPQRIDFGEIAMSFFSLKIADRVFWFTILSDTSDPRRATISFLRKFVAEAKEFLLEISSIEGLAILTPDTEKELNKIAEKILHKTTRMLPEIRSDDRKVLPFAIPLTLILTIFLNIAFYAYLLPSIKAPLEVTIGILLIHYGLIGILGGLISSRRLAGGISAYIAATVSPLAYGLYLSQIFIIASSLSIWSGIIGALTGSFVNSRKLTLTTQ